MSKLFVTEKFYKKFIEDENAKKVIALYGYSNVDKFLNAVIGLLNRQYPCLAIDGYSIMDHESSSIYSMYNGFVKGDFKEYDEVLVSFSDPFTKEGNTIISQQVMPMLQQKISQDIKFLYRKRIKKIFVLTSHKTNVFDVSKNSIKEDNYGSTLQLLVKCLLTLGFDVYPFIPVLNLNTTDKFNSVKELVENMDYIRGQNSGNLQHKPIVIDGNIVRGSFSQKPKGQDEKYFALRFLTAIYLNKHNKYDVSQAYSISDRSAMMQMLSDFADYMNLNDICYQEKQQLSDAEFMQLVTIEQDINEKLKQYAEKYGIDGTRSITTVVRLAEVQAELRTRLMKKHGGKCLLCGIAHEELLIASHIKPAVECDIYGKADPENALLLCANHDRLFDRALISFSFIDGKIMISDKLSQEERERCQLDENYHLPQELMTPERIMYLMWHNEEFEKKNGN